MHRTKSLANSSTGEEEEDEVIVFKGREEIATDIPFNLNLDDFDEPMPFHNDPPRNTNTSTMDGTFSLVNSSQQPWSSIWDEAPANQKSEFSKGFNSSSLFAFNSADHRSTYPNTNDRTNIANATESHTVADEAVSNPNQPTSAENVFLATRSLLQAPLPVPSTRGFNDNLPFPAWDRPSSQAQFKHDWEAFPRQSEQSPKKGLANGAALMPPPGKT